MDQAGETIAAKTTLVDVEHLGFTRSIAACLLEGDSGVAIIDPGPTSALETLRAKLAKLGLSFADIHTLLLTHIHLDHAGATGTLVKENPRIRVYVHERGAPHMVDPARLLASAVRLYGDQMDRLWGEVLPVPAENVQALAGGERLPVSGRTLEVIYTPGHASHHVSFLDRASGIAFVGDTAGIRIANTPLVTPVTPPPDIDLEGWRQSLAKIKAWRPERLFVTHFGPADNVEWHVEQLEEGLAGWDALVRESLARGESDAERARGFAQKIMADLRQHVPEDQAVRYAQGPGLEQSWYGLARYHRKRTT